MSATEYVYQKIACNMDMEGNKIKKDASKALNFLLMLIEKHKNVFLSKMRGPTTRTLRNDAVISYSLVSYLSIGVCCEGRKQVSKKC